MEIDHFAYEVEGLRDNGEVYAVEILGQQTEANAIMIAQHWADLWRATVNLVRVPYVDTNGSAHWRKDEVHFIQQIPPSRPLDR